MSVRKYDALALFLERARQINPDFDFEFSIHIRGCPDLSIV